MSLMNEEITYQDRHQTQIKDIKHITTEYANSKTSRIVGTPPIVEQDETDVDADDKDSNDDNCNLIESNQLFTADELYAIDGDDDGLEDARRYTPELDIRIRVDSTGRSSNASALSKEKDATLQPEQDEPNDMLFSDAMFNLGNIELMKRLQSIGKTGPYSRRSSYHTDIINLRSDSRGSGIPSRRTSVVSAIAGYASSMSTVVTDANQIEFANSFSPIPAHELDNAVELLLACERGDADETLALLFKDKVNPNVCGNNKRTPLHCAAGYGHKKIVELLLEADAYVDNKTFSGRTPLHEACIGGHTQVVSELLSHGADIDIQDNQLHSPLHLTAYNGEAKCVKILLEKGANAYLIDGSGRTAAHLAAINNHPGVMEELITSGINIDKRDDLGRHPTHLTCMHGSYHVLQLFYRYDVNLYCTDQTGAQPVHYASMINKLACLKYLIEIAGCDMDVRDNMNKALVHTAAQSGSVECLHWLLENNADPNTIDNLGQTPAHYAAAGGHVECFSCLLQHGVDTNYTYNEEIGTAFEAARRNGHPQIIHKAVQRTIRCRLCVAKEKRLKILEDTKPPEIISNIIENRTTVFSTSSFRETKSCKKNNKKTSENQTSNSPNRRLLAAKFYGPSLNEYNI